MPKSRISVVRLRTPFKEFTNGSHVNPRVAFNLGSIVRHMWLFLVKGIAIIPPDLSTKPGLPFFALTLFACSLFTPERAQSSVSNSRLKKTVQN